MPLFSRLPVKEPEDAFVVSAGKAWKRPCALLFLCRNHPGRRENLASAAGKCGAIGEYCYERHKMIASGEGKSVQAQECILCLQYAAERASAQETDHRTTWRMCRNIVKFLFKQPVFAYSGGRSATCGVSCVSSLENAKMHKKEKKGKNYGRIGKKRLLCSFAVLLHFYTI